MSKAHVYMTYEHKESNSLHVHVYMASYHTRLVLTNGQKNIDPLPKDVELQKQNYNIVFLLYVLPISELVGWLLDREP